MKPVTLPPGRGKLATKPLPTGSETAAKTIGMVRVCCSKVAVAGVPCERIEVGLQRDKFFGELLSSTPRRRASPSECRSGCCVPPSTRASGVRHGMRRQRLVLAGRSRHTPSIRRSAASGQAAAPARPAATQPAPPRRVMNSRRLIQSPRRRAARMSSRTDRPSALAVLRLTTSSNLFGDCAGKLPGNSPLRMRST